MLQKILPIVLVFASYLCTAQAYKQMLKYLYRNDDSLQATLVTIKCFNENGQPYFVDEIQSDCSTGKYYYYYRDTFLTKLVIVSPDDDSTIYTYDYVLDMKNRITMQMLFYASTLRFDVNDTPGWRYRKDTTLFIYRGNTRLETSPGHRTSGVWTYYDKHGRIIKEHNAVYFDKYEYTDSTTSSIHLFELPFRPANHNILEYSEKHVYKKAIWDELLKTGSIMTTN